MIGQSIRSQVFQKAGECYSLPLPSRRRRREEVLIETGVSSDVQSIYVIMWD